MDANRPERRRRTAVIWIVALIGFVILHYVILFAAADLTTGCGDLTQIRLKNAPVSGRDVERMVRDKNEEAESAKTAGTESGQADGADAGQAAGAGKAEPKAAPLYTAWTEAGGVEVENKELERRVSSDVIYYCGDNNLRFDLTQDLGCAVSAELAFRLWGTQLEDEVAGRSLLIDGREFTVEKVLPPGGWVEKWSGNSVIARVDGAAAEAKDAGQSANGVPAEEIRFDVLDVSLPDGNDVEDAGESSFSIDGVIMAAGLKPSSVIYYSELAAALHALRRLPVWGAVLCVAIPLLRRAGGSYREIKEREPESDFPMSFAERLREDGGLLMRRVIPPAALSVGLVLLTAVIAGTPFIVPDSFIPTKWSDFSFWTSAATEAGQTIRLFLTMELYGPDVWFRSLALRLIGGCVGQTILAVCAVAAARGAWAAAAARGIRVATAEIEGGIPAARCEAPAAELSRRFPLVADGTTGGRIRQLSAAVLRRCKKRNEGQ